jgi:hypothetical protein
MFQIYAGAESKQNLDVLPKGAINRWIARIVTAGRWKSCDPAL